MIKRVLANEASDDGIPSEIKICGHEFFRQVPSEPQICHHLLKFSSLSVRGSQIDSLKHSHKLEAASIKLECARSKGELERERDALHGQIDGMEHTHTHTLSLCREKWAVFLKYLLLTVEGINGLIGGA